MADRPNFIAKPLPVMPDNILLNVNTSIDATGDDVITVIPTVDEPRYVRKIFIQSLGENPKTAIRLFFYDSVNNISRMFESIEVAASLGTLDEAQPHVLYEADLHLGNNIGIRATTPIQLTTGISVASDVGAFNA